MTNNVSVTTPLIAHVIHKLTIGGLENGMVNLINNLPRGKYRHMVVALTVADDFKYRIQRDDVTIIELHKSEGKDLGMYYRLWKVFRQYRPSIVHTRNLSALESTVVAFLAGVPVRVHGEHGRDIYDIHGKNKRYQQLRRICNYFITRFVVVSQDLNLWLREEVGINASKIDQLYNGVNMDRFFPREQKLKNPDVLPESFEDEDLLLIGTVGRFEAVKSQITLVKAFIIMLKSDPELKSRLRLVLIGDGSERDRIERTIQDAGIESIVWLTGARDDVPELLRNLDIFVLPSLAEGISNTILEAMSSGLPVVATHVGGNAELVDEDKTGFLVEVDNPDRMANALLKYVNDGDKMKAHGENSLQRVKQQFSLSGMMQRYEDLYDSLLARC